MANTTLIVAQVVTVPNGVASSIGSLLTPGSQVVGRRMMVQSDSGGDSNTNSLSKTISIGGPGIGSTSPGLRISDGFDIQARDGSAVSLNEWYLFTDVVGQKVSVFLIGD